jgi:hypothetical protein
MSISGSVADTCRGGIDTFSFPDCRHSLGGAASPRLISPAASVYAVSRDVEVQDALVFARRNLHEPLSVDLLAEAARLSPRQFSRVFRVTWSAISDDAIRRTENHLDHPRSAIIRLVLAIARAGLSPLGQVLVQFMMVWQR